MSYIGNSPTQGAITGGNIVDGSIESIDLATLTNIDINSGSIDGTIIGASSAAAGTFSGLTVRNDTSNSGRMRVSSSATTAGEYRGYEFGNGSVFKGGLLQDQSTDMISLFTPIGGQSVNVTSSGNVGIGTASPSEKLTVAGNALFSTGYKLYGNSTSGTTSSYVSLYNTTDGGIDLMANYASSKITLGTAGSERMRIDSSGNVGIGHLAPASKLTVLESSGGNVGFFTNGADADLGINCTSGVTRLSPTTGTLAFGTSSTERARIDSSGNLLVGTTTSPVGSGGLSVSNRFTVGYQGALNGYGAENYSGIFYSGGNNSGYTAINSNSANGCLYLSRTASSPTGLIQHFASNGATVGAIGTVNSSTYYVFNNSKGITTDGTSNIVPCTNVGSKQGGGYMSLGNANYPFNDLYLSGGTAEGRVGRKSSISASSSVSTTHYLQTSQTEWQPLYIYIKVASGRVGLQEQQAAWYLYKGQSYNRSISSVALVDSGGNTANFSISITSTTSPSNAVVTIQATDSGTDRTVISTEIGSYANPIMS